MANIQKSFPTWILVVSGIFAAMEIVVGLSICFSPQSTMEHIDHQAKGVDYIMDMWGSRQFALGFIFAYATFKKSVPMLTLAYLFFLVMFAGDLVIGISQNEMGLIISAIVMCAIASLMLYMLNKAKKNAN